MPHYHQSDLEQNKFQKKFTQKSLSGQLWSWQTFEIKINVLVLNNIEIIYLKTF